MENSNSITEQIIALGAQGYTVKQIEAELKAQRGKASLRFIQRVIRNNRLIRADNRRLFEIYEMLLEVLAILHEIRGQDDSVIARRMRGIDEKIAALNGSAEPGKRP